VRSLSIALSLAISMTGCPAMAEGAGSAPTTENPPSRRVQRFEVRGYDERPTLARVADDEASQVDDIETRIAVLSSERDAISRRGPLAAMIVGSVSSGVGLTFATAGGLICAFSAGSCTPGSIGAVAGFGAVGIAGIVTFFAGRAKLRERNRERESIDREIRSLENRRAGRMIPTVGFGIGRNHDPGLVLGWTF
jgi:hypothetical protein